MASFQIDPKNQKRQKIYRNKEVEYIDEHLYQNESD